MAVAEEYEDCEVSLPTLFRCEQGQGKITVEGILLRHLSDGLRPSILLVTEHLKSVNHVLLGNGCGHLPSSHRPTSESDPFRI